MRLGDGLTGGTFSESCIQDCQAHQASLVLSYVYIGAKPDCETGWDMLSILRSRSRPHRSFGFRVGYFCAFRWGRHQPMQRWSDTIQRTSAWEKESFPRRAN
jgi:hypothetical protein